jgi:hypothetical protein
MNIDNLLDDFIKVCELSHIQLHKNDIKIEILKAGQNHNPQKLPQGQMAVYVFSNSSMDTCYKVGKVGGSVKNVKNKHQR